MGIVVVAQSNLESRWSINSLLRSFCAGWRIWIFLLQKPCPNLQARTRDTSFPAFLGSIHHQVDSW